VRRKSSPHHQRQQGDGPRSGRRQWVESSDRNVFDEGRRIAPVAGSPSLARQYVSGITARRISESRCEGLEVVGGRLIRETTLGCFWNLICGRLSFPRGVSTNRLAEALEGSYSLGCVWGGIQGGVDLPARVQCQPRTGITLRSSFQAQHEHSRDTLGSVPLTNRIQRQEESIEDELRCKRLKFQISRCVDFLDRLVTDDAVSGPSSKPALHRPQRGSDPRTPEFVRSIDPRRPGWRVAVGRVLVELYFGASRKNR
jgi:hypothetical protein